MNWIKDNIKWLIPIVSFIGGLMLGFYLAILRYEGSLEVVREKVTDIKDDVHDLKILIQNKVLTQPTE